MSLLFADTRTGAGNERERVLCQRRARFTEQAPVMTKWKDCFMEMWRLTFFTRCYCSLHGVLPAPRVYGAFVNSYRAFPFNYRRWSLFILYHFCYSESPWKYIAPHVTKTVTQSRSKYTKNTNEAVLGKLISCRTNVSGLLYLYINSCMKVSLGNRPLRFGKESVCNGSFASESGFSSQFVWLHLLNVSHMHDVWSCC